MRNTNKRFISSTTGPFLCSPNHFQFTTTLVNLMATSSCRAKMYAYAIRTGYLPPEVLKLLGGFPPSTGHAKRLCKLVRSETWKQVERYRDCLKVMCFGRAPDQPAAERSFASHLRSAEQMTEFLWRRQLTMLPKKRSTSKIKQGGVTFLGGATLPEDIKATLEKGPKFAVEPKLLPPRKAVNGQSHGR